MKLMKKMAFVFVCILALGASATVAAYPTKPITMVVGYAAGGGTHLAAEILAPGAEKFLGQPLEIVCKPGAGGAIGTTYVAKAPKDGYTILYATLSLPTAPLLGKVGYKTDEFVGVAQCSDVASVLAVRADAPFNNAKEMVEWAKAHPGQFSWSHPGVGSSLHIQGANAIYQMGIANVTKDIPAKGTAPGIANVLGGHVTAISSFFPALSENVKAGQMKVIGVVGLKRLEELPDVPTFDEQGYPALVTSWRGVFCHKDVPMEIRKYLEEVFAKIIASTEYQERAKKLGEPQVYANSEEFTKVLMKGHEDMSVLVKAIGLAK